MPILHFGLGGRERAPSFAKDLYILFGNVASRLPHTNVYINADNVTGPLPPIPNGGYLIEGRVGSKKGTMTMWKFNRLLLQQREDLGVKIRLLTIGIE